VNVDYDSSTSDEMDETYDPNNVVTLSMQRTERTAGGPPQVAGVPGTSSNAPNTKPPVYPTSTPQTDSEKQESGTYAASKKVRHVTQGPGKVRRMTAAVLINEQKVVSGGKVSWQPRSPEEMKRLTELAEAAIGYDAARGDTVSVVELPFQEEITPRIPFGQKLLAAAESGPLLKYGVILLALLVLLVLFARPVLAVLKPAPVAALKAPPQAAALERGEEPDVLEDSPAEQKKQHMQKVFDQVSDHLNQEPAQSTRLLQSWINTE
jgi:flagellar M-ring protein FliF